MKFAVFQMSRKGGREKNEDRMGYSFTNSSGLFLLADGMGGHPEGEVAAQIALQSISALFQKEAKPEVADVRSFFNLAVMTAHRQILRYAAQKGLPDTPRTTLVAAVMQNGAISWVHCGDSRLYLVRQGELIARTRDHSYIEQSISRPGMPPLPAHINRNVLYTCLGSPTKPVFDISGPVMLQQGDRLMLCSDGLWSSLPDADVVSFLSNKVVESSVPDMIEAALLKAGPGSDNVTVLAVEWQTPDGFESTLGGTPSENADDGGFSTTVQADWGDHGADLVEDLNEDDIERSIAEINEAIKRTANRKS